MFCMCVLKYSKKKSVLADETTKSRLKISCYLIMTISEITFKMPYLMIMKENYPKVNSVEKKHFCY